MMTKSPPEIDALSRITPILEPLAKEKLRVTMALLNLWIDARDSNKGPLDAADSPSAADVDKNITKGNVLPAGVAIHDTTPDDFSDFLTSFTPRNKSQKVLIVAYWLCSKNEHSQFRIGDINLTLRKAKEEKATNISKTISLLKEYSSLVEIKPNDEGRRGAAIYALTDAGIKKMDEIEKTHEGERLEIQRIRKAPISFQT